MEKYRPSNGTEGDIFISKFCANCIHEKFMHTQKHGDAQCDIFNRTILHDIDDPNYPEEWVHDDNGRGICTAFSKWDWGKDDDGNWNDPPPIYPDDPNQLCMPFIMDEIGVPKTKLNYQL